MSTWDNSIRKITRQYVLELMRDGKEHTKGEIIAGVADRFAREDKNVVETSTKRAVDLALGDTFAYARIGHGRYQLKSAFLRSKSRADYLSGCIGEILEKAINGIEGCINSNIPVFGKSDSDVMNVITTAENIVDYLRESQNALQMPKEQEKASVLQKTSKAQKYDYNLFFPLAVKLSYGEKGDKCIEPYCVKDISPHNIEAINKAFREHPVITSAENGLMQYFYSDDDVYLNYVMSNISFATLSVVHVNESLYGMVTYTVNSNSELSYRIVDALKEDVERAPNNWGEGDFEVKIPVSDDIPLQNAVLNVMICSYYLGFVETLEDFQQRHGCKVTTEKSPSPHRPAEEVSVLKKIKQHKKTAASEKSKTKKQTKNMEER
jgi:hypothetical protein